MTDKPAYVPRVSRAFVQKLMRLLFMEYKVSELADEMGISTKTIYTQYLPAGMPHRKDEAGNIWIVGTEFTDWVNDVLEKGARYSSQRKRPLSENEAYCVSCRSVREFEKITRRDNYSGGRVMLFGPCIVCGTRMSIMRKGAK